MAIPKQLGIFWGEERIILVESQNNQPLRIIPIPINPAPPAGSPFSSTLTEEIQLVASLQKSLRGSAIEGANIHFSLPFKDVIVRCFVVPMVKPKEIPGIIAFEAKKYLPFDLKDLAYVYHPMPFIDNKVKRLRIVFYGIRISALERYERVFKQANLNLVISEPAPVSLAKVLITRKQIALNQKTSVIQLEDNFGRMIFFENGIPQFVREFQLNTSQDASSKLDPELFKTRLFNEVRNSFDFYTRQFSNEKFTDVIIMSAQANPELDAFINQEWNVVAKQWVAPSVTGGEKLQAEAAYALGSCTGGLPASFPILNFSHKKESSSKRISKNFVLNIKEFEPCFKTVIICALLVGGFFAFTQMKYKESQAKIQTLFTQQGTFTESTAESIEALITAQQTKLKGYKDIRMKSKSLVVLAHVAKVLPAGVWLREINITYPDFDKEKIKMDINGFAYDVDPNAQIKIVNDFILKLRTAKELASFITIVQLRSISRQEENKQAVVSFSINCL